MSAKASPSPIFMDRDGTIVQEVHYLSSLHQMQLLPGAGEAIGCANKEGRPVIVISNQSGVARGLFSEDFARESADHLRVLLAKHRAHIDGYYYCPYHPQGRPPYNADSDDRKPRPGMMLRAAADMDVKLEGAWMIGDRNSDLETGAELGVRPILVRTGYGGETEAGLTPAFGKRGGRVFDNLAGAVAWILDQHE